MSNESENLDFISALATQQDIHNIFETEKELRLEVLQWGAECAPFEVLPDDERICDFCKTTCFLSAVSCFCDKDKLVCLKHYDKLCECPPILHTLKYRFTLEQFCVLIKKVQDRTREYEKWMAVVKTGLYEVDGDDKMEIETLRDLVKEAEKNRYPKTPLLDAANNFLKEAEKCSEIAQKLTMPMIRTRMRTDDTRYRVTQHELKSVVEILDSLPVHLKESATIRRLMKNFNGFSTKARALLKDSDPKTNDLKACLNVGLTLEIDLPEIALLQSCLDRRVWLEQVDDSDTLWTVDYLNKCIETGNKLEKNKIVEEKLNTLKLLELALEDWEEKAKAVMNPENMGTVKDYESVLETAADINIALPSLPTLRNILQKCADFIQKVQSMKQVNSFIFLDELEKIALKGESIPVRMEELTIIQSQVNGAKIWWENCSKAFLKKNTSITLLEALIPRREIRELPHIPKKRKNIEPCSLIQMATMFGLTVKEIRAGANLMPIVSHLQQVELAKMRELRSGNLAKRKNDNGDRKYCICQSALSNGFAIRCDICFEWFHATCVALPKLSENPDPGVSSHTMTAHRIASGLMKYFCPCCGRSRRPKLEEVHDLLEPLKKMGVRHPESEALHSLAERAVSWMDSAKSLLDNPDVSAVVQAIEAPLTTSPNTSTPPSSTSSPQKSGAPISSPQKSLDVNSFVTVKTDMNDPDAQRSAKGKQTLSSPIKEHTFSMPIKGEPNITNVELLLSAQIKGEPIPPPNNIDPSIKGDLHVTTPLNTEPNIPREIKETTPTKKGLNTSPLKKEFAGSLESLANPLDHAYSTSPSRNGHQRKDNLNPSRTGLVGCISRLSTRTLNDIENVVLTGDLMEVGFAESDMLWRVLEATRQRPPVPNILELQKILEEEILQKNLVNTLGKKRSSAKSASATPASKKARMVQKKGTGPKKPVQAPKRKTKSASRDEETTTAKKSSATQEYEEDCAAVPCKQPRGRGINWIQCDVGCEKWFHLTCVNMSKSEVKKIEHYECTLCGKKEIEPNLSAEGRRFHGSSEEEEENSRESNQCGQQSICSNKENAEDHIDEATSPPTAPGLGESKSISDNSMISP